MSPARSLRLLPALALGGCVHLAAPHLPAPPPPVAVPRCPGALSAVLQPQPAPPAAAGLIRAQTDEEADAQRATLTWLHDLAAWGRTGWARATAAKTWCDGR